MCGKEFNGFSNVDAIGGADVHLIASVVVGGTADVVSFLAMHCPGAALFWSFMDQHLGS